jgi:L-ascorbate metabolism protein UlaG (beta-lactamase superfamily)
MRGSFNERHLFRSSIRTGHSTRKTAGMGMDSMAEKYTIDLPEMRSVPADEPGSIFFVGTATTLIRNNGFTLLTYPNFIHAGDHVHPGYGLISERLTNPAIDIEQLPPVDACLLSHMHGDHWDQVADQKLRRDLPVLTTQEAVDNLRSKGFTRLYALDKWDQARVNKADRWLRVTSLPGKHGPLIVDMALPSVMGSMLGWGKGADAVGLRIYVSGDTLVFDELEEIPKRYPAIDLGPFHLGGTKILGILVTMDAKQGIDAIHIIQPKHAIPIHYNDYPVFKSSLDEFNRAVSRAGLEDRVHYLKHGDTFSFDQLKHKAELAQR